MSTRVLVVDDSAFMRHMLARLLKEAGCEVVGTARDGLEAVAMARELRPDVISLDVEMPRLDGLGALRAIMADRPVPVVMCSSLTTADAQATVDALAAGAVDVVAKPSGPSGGLSAVRDELVAKVRIAAGAHPRRVSARAAKVVGGPATSSRRYGLVVIGASTGGPAALHRLVPQLPADMPPLLLVQHMPAGFTRALAERLDRESALRVREAASGDRCEAGLALLAPGGAHMVLSADGTVQCTDGPTRHGVRPSVDVTLESVHATRGGDAVVAILTGMGADGAAGALRVRSSGGYVLGEAESSCVVYGMPRAARELRAVDCEVPLSEMASALVAGVARGGRRVP